MRVLPVSPANPTRGIALILSIVALCSLQLTIGSSYLNRDIIHSPYSLAYLEDMPLADSPALSRNQNPTWRWALFNEHAGLLALCMVSGEDHHEIHLCSRSGPYILTTAMYFLDSYFNQSKYKPPVAGNSSMIFHQLYRGFIQWLTKTVGKIEPARKIFHDQRRIPHGPGRILHTPMREPRIGERSSSCHPYWWAWQECSGGL